MYIMGDTDTQHYVHGRLKPYQREYLVLNFYFIVGSERTYLQEEQW